VQLLQTAQASLEGIFQATWGYLRETTISDPYPWDCFSIGGVAYFLILNFLGLKLGQTFAYRRDVGNTSQGRPKNLKDVLRVLAPREVWLSQQMAQDLLLSFNILLMFGIYIYFSLPVSAGGVGKRAIYWLSRVTHLPLNPVQYTSHGPLVDLGYAVVLLVMMELGHWIYHFLSHKVPSLWELHKVHHAPSTMSPATDYRLHPIDYTLLFFTQGLFVGIGSFLFNLIFGFNSIGHFSHFVEFWFLLIIYLPSTLHHSYRWWSWGSLERVILSPACHTLHHSSDPRYYNTNFGLRLTVFDQLFGTFSKPTKHPPADGIDIGIRDEHYNWADASYWRLMIDPVKKSFAVLFR